MLHYTAATLHLLRPVLALSTFLISFTSRHTSRKQKQKTKQNPVNISFCFSMEMFHKLLQLLWISSAGCSPPSNGLLQHGHPSESRPPLDTPPSAAWVSPGATGSILPHYSSPWAAGAQPAISPPATGEQLLQHTYLPPSSLTWVSPWLSLSSPVPLQNKTNPRKKINCSTGFSPFSYVIAEALIGPAVARAGSDLGLGKLLKVSYRRHTNSPLPHYQKPTRHKPNTQIPKGPASSFYNLATFVLPVTPMKSMNLKFMNF